MCVCLCVCMMLNVTLSFYATDAICHVDSKSIIEKGEHSNYQGLFASLCVCAAQCCRYRGKKLPCPRVTVVKGCAAHPEDALPCAYAMHSIEVWATSQIVDHELRVQTQVFQVTGVFDKEFCQPAIHPSLSPPAA